MFSGVSPRIAALVDANFARQTAFLAELVKVASDNPPGDCAPHAAHAVQVGHVERFNPTWQAFESAAFRPTFIEARRASLRGVPTGP